MRVTLRRIDQALLDWVPARQLAVTRIVVGMALVLEILYRIRVRGLEPFDPDVLHVPYFEWFPVPSPALGAVLFGVIIAAGMLFTLGWRTRLNGILVILALSWYWLADQQNYTNHTYLFVLVIAILVLGNSGAALSLDSRRRETSDTVEAWPVVLLQAQLVIIYFWASVQKINGSYLQGEVIAERATNLGPIAIPNDLPPDVLLIAIAVGSICAEAFLAVGLWFRRLRPAAFGVAFLLHIGILVGMNNLANSVTIFTIQWIGVLILFIDPTPRAVSVSVGHERWVEIARRLDWLGKLEVGVTPGKPLEVIVEGEQQQGFAALVAVLEVLPVSFLWAPLLRPAAAWSARRRGFTPVGAPTPGDARAGGAM